jgi:hypothetical protein
MNSSNEADRRLPDRCLAGDRKAAETLVRQYSGPVYRPVFEEIPYGRYNPMFTREGEKPGIHRFLTKETAHDGR